MKYLKTVLLGLLLGSAPLLKAEEGMWLPFLLEKLNEQQMKSLGMRISAKDIYSINKGSLKDAIVSFGGFCTGEVISSKGLVLTNHHCGFDAVQNHSTLDRNYIRDGFWAKNHAEELANPKLFVTFIVRIEDVSKQVLNGVMAAMSESERQSLVDRNSAELINTIKKERYQSALIKPFFEGNHYYLFVTETYNDVRLVGTPPSSIGNFGKDTDNWMWPRHTGDFSMFRIYAGKDNKPAAYSADNVPYVPKRPISISLDGVVENDFTMVFGFPGKTMQYLHSEAVDQIVKINDPAKIAIRDKALNIIDGFMRKSEEIKIQYAAKYASMSNSWKKWQGEVLGLTRTNAVQKKKNQEDEFQKRVNTNPQWKSLFGNILVDLQAAYTQIKPYGLARDYYLEISSKIELFTIAAQLNSLLKAYETGADKAYTDQLVIVKEKLDELYKEYSAEVDQKLFGSLMEMYIKDQPAEYVSLYAKNLRNPQDKKDEGTGLMEKIFYTESVLSDKVKLYRDYLSRDPKQAIDLIANDNAMRLYIDMVSTYNTRVAARLNPLQNRINQLQRTYMRAQMEVMKEKRFYPDANSTLRLTYGKVKGFQARDAVKYDYYSYMDGLMEKYKPADYEFDLPEKLRELYQKKDFGQYGKNGKMPVCFIATNHTTGGNSGSPVLDAYGNLVGLNFDRAWEGTMSDVNYDPSICRNIMVDIRYILFVIDKYAGAGHLIKEMKLVHPRKK
jgi:Peptidase S46